MARPLREIVPLSEANTTDTSKSRQADQDDLRRRTSEFIKKDPSRLHWPGWRKDQLSPDLLKKYKKAGYQPK